MAAFWPLGPEPMTSRSRSTTRRYRPDANGGCPPSGPSLANRTSRSLGGLVGRALAGLEPGRRPEHLGHARSEGQVALDREPAREQQLPCVYLLRDQPGEV